ncbi:flagellar basal body-associated protein FliL [Tropicibacter sp. Alg240-R139]|uniref:flagellar basal body-associated protein FliL n=1 Tax=Tropicibacter sp. Alg240-R139 TaxID=2305991 RepID=UPI0013E073EF|nr:flagellar basal body-associated protein FliL [Tropicibacter sp. Alg240-R139]
MKKLLPILFLIVGLGAGVGAGVFLGPGEKKHDMAEDAEPEHHKEDENKKEAKAKPEKDEKSSGSEYVKLPKQFVIPIVTKDHISALATVSLSLETVEGSTEAVYSKEPKLRDMFLQVLFDHANMGGFDGAFTRPDNLAPLRKALNEVARKELGDIVKDVLIVDIARQDT